MLRTLTVFAATSFLCVALACGGAKTADGKSGCPMAAAKMAQAAQADVQAAEGAKIALDVSGMTCEGCANAVQAALMKIDGVKAAYVSSESGRAEIAFDDKKTSLDALIAAVDGAGDYTAKKSDKPLVN